MVMSINGLGAAGISRTCRLAALGTALQQMTSQSTWLGVCSGEPVGSPRLVERWQLELDRLELDVMRVERAFATDGLLRTDEWEVPSLTDPVPEDLRRRAADIRRRQEGLIVGLAERLAALST